MFDNGRDTMSFQIHNVRGEELMTTLDWSRGEVFSPGYNSYVKHVLSC
jgi:hypothetical protein